MTRRPRGLHLLGASFLIASASSTESGSPRSPCTSQRPLAAILAFGENRPSQDAEGPHSRHDATVAIIFVSSRRRSALSGTPRTTKLNSSRMRSVTCRSTSARTALPEQLAIGVSVGFVRLWQRDLIAWHSRFPLVADQTDYRHRRSFCPRTVKVLPDAFAGRLLLIKVTRAGWPVDSSSCRLRPSPAAP